MVGKRDLEHCPWHGASGIPRLGLGFAEQPLFPNHAVQQLAICAGGGAQARQLGWFAVFEVVQNAVLNVLLGGGAAGAARGTLCRASVERGAASLGNSQENAAADLGHQRQHGAQHLTERAQVVAGDPAGQLHQVGRDDGVSVENGEQRFCWNRGWLIVQASDDAGHFLVTEGRQHPCAQGRRGQMLGAAVGPYAVQRYGQRDITKDRHWDEANSVWSRAACVPCCVACGFPPGKGWATTMIASLGSGFVAQAEIDCLPAAGIGNFPEYDFALPIAHDRSARYSEGVVPNAHSKEREKCDWFEKPHCKAMSANAMFRLRRSDSALLMRDRR